MADIFSYTNYRAFLKDVYHERKKKNSFYSYKMLADKAGFKSKSFIAHVLDGAKNISDDSIAGISKAFSLNEEESAYFTLLVHFNQAETIEDKRRTLGLCIQFQGSRRHAILLKDTYSLFSRWYHTIILEMINGNRFNGDFKELARTLVPRITVKEARESVALLVKLGLVTAEKRTYRTTNRMLSTGDEVHSLAVADFHKECFSLAVQSIATCESSQRDISCLVGALSPAGFALLKSEIQLFRKRLIGLIDQDIDPTKVYLINFQLFPVTTSIENKENICQKA